MAPDTGDRYWDGLDPAQADAQACVICGRRFRGSGWVLLPVGRSRTGSQVFVCAGVCAETATAPGAVLIPEEALTAAGVAFLAALETAGGDLARAWPDDLVTAIVSAAAPLIVAAELRRLANEMAYAPACRALEARADALDPAGGERR